jgi:hypothetical protein
MKTSLTADDIAQIVVKADYFLFPETTLTVCCLTLKNGFAVIGESACADPMNFDAAVGRSIANKNAMDKVWQLEGYRLKQSLYSGSALAEAQALEAEYERGLKDGAAALDAEIAKLVAVHQAALAEAAAAATTPVDPVPQAPADPAPATV